MTVANRIRQRRRRLLMKQRELGGERWTRSFISQIELGKVVRSPGQDHARKGNPTNSTEREERLQKAVVVTRNMERSGR